MSQDGEISTAELLKQVDEMRQQEDYWEAFDFLKTVMNGNDIQMQWKLAEVCWELCNRNGFHPPEVSICKAKLYDYSEQNPNCGRTHKALALLLLLDKTLSVSRHGLEQLKKLEDHIQRAIDLTPEDGQAHYLMGMYSFEMATAGLRFKKLCTILTGSAPSATIDEALQHFYKANKLIRGNRSNVLLMIAQCLFRLGKKSEATDYLKECVANETEARPKFRFNSKLARVIASVEGVSIIG